MVFVPSQFKREGIIRIKASLEDVFPLLCPKKEEEWIPGWECETIWSHSGYNETGAIFRTTKPYATELLWTTLQYEIVNKIVDFLIHAANRFVFRFRITVSDGSDGFLVLTFSQTFTSISEEGNELITLYQEEDFSGRLNNLGQFMSKYLLTK